MARTALLVIGSRDSQTGSPPRSPWDRATGRIPGGSTSGGAVSVADGMAAAALGTDTSGSVRMPSAACGLTGFKPTARRVPLKGIVPLSTTLDSVGPLARCVTDAALGKVAAWDQKVRAHSDALTKMTAAVAQRANQVTQALSYQTAEMRDASNDANVLLETLKEQKNLKDHNSLKSQIKLLEQKQMRVF